MNCSRRLIPGQVGVNLWVNGDNLYFTGLQRCGSVWACPECAGVIATGRTDELRRAVRSIRMRGMGLAWQLLTMPHDATDVLEDTLAIISEGWRKIRQGRGWRALADRLKVCGTIRKVEITHGQNGWHPHTHIAFISERPLTPAQLRELEGYVFGAWSAIVTGFGFRPPHADLCRAEVIDLAETPRGCTADEWADYMGKSFGREMVGQGKVSRSLVGRQPFELLSEACEARRGLSLRGPIRHEWWREQYEMHKLLGRSFTAGRARHLWREYEAATLGRRQLVWSQGLRARLEINGGVEPTEQQELALGEELQVAGAEHFYTIDRLTWRMLWATGKVTTLFYLAGRPLPIADRRKYLEHWLDSLYVSEQW